MLKIQKTTLLLGAVCALVVTTQRPARAEMLTFGIFGANTSNASNVVRDVLGVDATSPHVQGMNVLTDLCGIDVLWVLNLRKRYRNGLLENLDVIEAFVDRGGTLILHDSAVVRYTTDPDDLYMKDDITSAADVLPGGSGINFVKASATDTNVADNSTIVTNGAGPGGAILDGTLDTTLLPLPYPQDYSNHGYATSSSLPGSATAILTQSDPTQVVDFTYDYGAGHVYYSTIPMGYYLNGTSNPFADNYAPNVIAYANSIGQQVACASAISPPMVPVPEPSSLTIFAVSGCVAGLVARRRQRRNTKPS